MSHLRDQNLVLRAAQTNFSNGKDPNVSSNQIETENEELEKYKAQIRELESRLSTLKINQEEGKIVDQNQATKFEEILRQRTSELEKLRKDQEDLLELLSDQDTKITMYKERLLSLGEKVKSYFYNLNFSSI